MLQCVLIVVILELPSKEVINNTWQENSTIVEKYVTFNLKSNLFFILHLCEQHWLLLYLFPRTDISSFQDNKDRFGPLKRGTDLQCSAYYL